MGLCETTVICDISSGAQGDQLPNGEIWSSSNGAIYYHVDNSCTELDTRLYLSSFRPRLDVLISDEKGILWGLGNQIHKYDPENDVLEVRNLFTPVDEFRETPYLGCAIYHQRLKEIFWINSYGEVFRLDTSDIRNSTYLSSFEAERDSMIPDRPTLFTYIRTSCNDEEIFVKLNRGIFSLDIFTGDLQLKCDTSLLSQLDLEDAFVPWTIQPGDCDLIIDLDKNDFSQQGKDRSDTINCDINLEIGYRPYLDSINTIVHSDLGNIDSLSFELLNPIDGADESIQYTLLNNMSEVINGRKITVISPSGDFSDYQNFLETINYINTACLPSQGQRQIRFIAYGSGLSDTAFLYLRVVGERVNAGADHTFIYCPEDAPLDLLDSLAGCRTLGGYYDPPLMAIDFFNPAIDASGDYLYIVESMDCRSDTAILTFVEKKRPIFDLGNDTSICQNIEIGWSKMTDSLSFLWSHGDQSPTIMVDASGTFILTAFHDNGCSFSDTIRIDFLQNDTIAIDSSICEDETIVWKGQTIGSSGTFTHQNPADCDTLFQLTVTYSPLPQTDLADTIYLCEGEVATIDGGSHQSYMWSTGENTRKIDVDSEGLITLLISDNDKCFLLDSVFIVIESLSPIDLGQDREVEAGTQITIQVAADPNAILSYYLVNGDTTYGHDIDLVIESETQVIYCKMSASGCIACDHIRISVKTPNIFISNIFSPNGDGINDFMTLHSNGDVMIEVFEIYDRWGELVASIKNSSVDSDIELWDGKFRGQNVSLGVYVYNLKVRHGSGTVSRYGNVTVLY